MTFTHKQPNERADTDLTDDTVAKRAKLSDTPSSSSSRHEIAPNSHYSSGEVDDPETRESVMKKSRVDADMKISAIEALTNAKLEVDRALDKANKTSHRLLEEIPLESEAVTSAADLNSTRYKRVYTEVYENEAVAKIISGKWVLKPHKARYVLERTLVKTKEGTTSDANSMLEEFIMSALKSSPTLPLRMLGAR